MEPVRLEVWSDYLCPWCYNAAHRLERLRRELGPSLELRWRSFLLRPRPGGSALERFVRYTDSWRRPAAEPDAPGFRVWASREGPPSHSLPPHRMAKAAAGIGPDAFRAVHERLLRAYFAESRDITAEATQRDLWRELGLPEEGLAAAAAPEVQEAVLAEHRLALERGITGVPAVAVEGHEGFVMGAQPLAVYRRWVERLRAGVLD